MTTPTSDREALLALADTLGAAISWIEPPFIDGQTSHEEIMLRIGFCVKDANRAIQVLRALAGDRP
jgi:hypothetical protein